MSVNRQPAPSPNYWFGSARNEDFVRPRIRLYYQPARNKFANVIELIRELLDQTLLLLWSQSVERSYVSDAIFQFRLRVFEYLCFVFVYQLFDQSLLPEQVTFVLPVFHQHLCEHLLEERC